VSRNGQITFGKAVCMVLGKERDVDVEDQGQCEIPRKAVTLPTVGWMSKKLDFWDEPAAIARVCAENVKGKKR
jgi:hypothetical protein